MLKIFLSHPEKHLTSFIFPSEALASFRFEGCCWQKEDGLERTRVVERGGCQRDCSVQHPREDQKQRNGVFLLVFLLQFCYRHLFLFFKEGGKNANFCLIHSEGLSVTPKVLL